MWGALWIGLIVAAAWLCSVWWRWSELSRLAEAVATADDSQAEGGEDAEVGPHSDAVATRLSGSKRERILAWIGGALLLVFVRSVAGVFQPSVEPLFAFLGGLAGEGWYRRRNARLLARQVAELERGLPMTMERIVMAVGSGLDVVPALKVAADGEQGLVARHIGRVVALSESGLPLVAALRTVSSEAPSTSFKHALIHLAVAYEQGGELVRPLRELSDATQLHYQESIEEEIAKLPVKAVLPLVLTFTGLILCFLTVPLLQVASLTKKVSHAAAQE